MAAPQSDRRLLVEGWRFMTHSFAQVNQFQLLELMQCGLDALAHRDLPFLFPHWKSQAGLLSQEIEQRLRQIPPPTPGERFDAVYRIAAPFDFRDSPDAPRTFVFCPTEFKIVASELVAGRRQFAEAIKDSSAMIVTPSQWSRQGLIQSGADPTRIVVVPHGVDTNLFRPASGEERAQLRQKFSLNGFVFLNISTMAGNKGIPMLLKAFAAVLEKHPDCQLLLKGVDSLYESHQRLAEKFKLLTAAETQRIQPRIKYIGQDLSATEIVSLYQSADAYVSPYFAEGFNLPALEAIACGLPLICTAGGPTDDFTRDDFALRIESKVIPVPTGIHAGGSALEPNLDHLIALMNQLIKDSSIAGRARSNGPAYVAANFTWHGVVGKLMDVMFPS